MISCVLFEFAKKKKPKKSKETRNDEMEKKCTGPSSVPDEKNDSGESAHVARQKSLDVETAFYCATQSHSAKSNAPLSHTQDPTLPISNGAAQGKVVIAPTTDDLISMEIKPPSPAIPVIRNPLPHIVHRRMAGDAPRIGLSKAPPKKVEVSPACRP